MNHKGHEHFETSTNLRTLENNYILLSVISKFCLRRYLENWGAYGHQIRGSVEYFRIKNWDKYQENKKTKLGQLPYLKLYTCTLDDPKVDGMSAYEFAIWVKLLLTARRIDNLFPRDDRWLTARLGFWRANRRVDLEFLWVLGLLEAVSCPGEEKRGEEKRREEGCEKLPPDRDLVFELIEQWNKYAKVKHVGFFPKRIEVLVKFWQEIPDIKYWENIFKTASESGFLNSNEKKKWKLTIEWAMQHHIEISEGKYTDEKTAKLIPSDSRKLR